MPTASPRVRRSTSTRTPRRRLPRSTFSAVEDAVEAIRRGGMVIVVDDEDRENEGDLTIAAEKVTAKAINFMMTHGRGLICMPMTPDRLDELEVPLQVPATRNTTPFDTAFCVGIEARRGVSTGISAGDRATTILTAINPKTRPMDLARPGSRVPAAGPRRRRAGAGRADRGGRRSGPCRRPLSGRGDLRDRQGRRQHGPGSRPDEVRAAPPACRSSRWPT